MVFKKNGYDIITHMDLSSNVKKTVFYAACLSVSLVLSYIESVLPFNVGIPGAKIGLPNIITMLLLFNGGVIPAALIGFMRIVLTGFMFGNMFSILYSLGGAALSLAVMAILKKTELLGVIGISTAGGVMHNLGQLIIAAFVTNKYVFAYFPVLFLSGVLAGTVIGTAGGILIKRLEPLIKKQFGGVWN